MKDTFGPIILYVHCREVVHSSEVENVLESQESLLIFNLVP